VSHADEIVPLLLPLITEKDIMVRQMATGLAVSLLLELKESEAGVEMHDEFVAELVAQLGHDDVEVVESTLSAMVCFPSFPETIAPILVDLLTDAKISNHWDVAGILKKMRKDVVIPLLVSALHRGESSKAILEVIEAVGHNSVEIRGELMELAEESPDPGPFFGVFKSIGLTPIHASFISKFTGSENLPHVRLQALSACEDMGRYLVGVDKIVDLVLTLTFDEDEDVRDAVPETLALIRENATEGVKRQIQERLLPMARSRNLTKIKVGLLGLTEYREEIPADDPLVPTLIKLSKGTKFGGDEDDSIRYYVVGALATVIPRSAEIAEILYSNLEHPDGLVSHAAATALTGGINDL